MRAGSLAFLLGVCIVLVLPCLPSTNAIIIFSVICIAVSVVCRQVAKFILIFISGFLYVVFWIYQHDHSLDIQSLLNGKHHVGGVVSSIVQQAGAVQSFNFAVRELDHKTVSPIINVKVRWYYSDKSPKVGEYWDVYGKFKFPRGFKNPGSVDLAKAYKIAGLDGILNVAKSAENRLRFHTSEFPLMQFRSTLNSALSTKLLGLSHGPIIRALLLGVREGISEADWQMFRNTGTSHLMSISGLHIGLIAGLMYFLLCFPLRFSSGALRCIPAAKIASLGSLVAAVAYAVISGFGVPQERAVIMLSTFVLSRFLGFSLSTWSAWCLALWFVIVSKPLNVFMPGFWLSFIAVAIMIRVAREKYKYKISKIVVSQLLITIGMLPLCLLFFSGFSIVAPFVNIIAIPFVGFFVVPVCFLAAFMHLFSSLFSMELFSLGNFLISVLLTFMRVASQFTFSSVHLSVHQVWVWVIIYISCAVFVIFKKGRPVSLLGLFFLFHTEKPLAYGVARFTLLDVGQGLSAVIQTKSHTLVYDTGPIYGGSFNAGSAVLLPFLLDTNIRSVDMTMISHGDSDHRGGVRSLLAGIKVQEIKTSIPRFHASMPVSHCYTGQHWRWDGVIFRVMYPPRGLHYTDNNSSCVLQVITNKHRYLLVGDIEEASESYLVKQATDLKSDVLVVPHHGSHTSSTNAFLSAVKPRIALYSTGLNNHYHFPHPSVVARYKKLGIKTFNTATYGAITFDDMQDDLLHGVSLYSRDHPSWWNVS